MGITASVPKTNHPSVLVIDDDPGTRETFDRALVAHGLVVDTAGSAAEALAMTRRRFFDLILIDLRLPDMLGTDLARALHHELPTSRLILISGFLTTRITVEAVRIGAIDVMEKPVAVEDLLATVDTIFRDHPASPTGESGASLPTTRQRSRSAAERWAMNVLKACESHADIRTLDDWAACVGLSYSSLCESCRLLRIRPHDARDLARVLRAIITSRGRSDLGVLFDVSDMRTLKNLLNRAGLNPASSADPVLIDQFLERQRFVPSSNEGLIVLKQLLATRSTKV